MGAGLTFLGGGKARYRSGGHEQGTEFVHNPVTRRGADRLERYGDDVWHRACSLPAMNAISCNESRPSRQAVWLVAAAATPFSSVMLSIVSIADSPLRSGRQPFSSLRT